MHVVPGSRAIAAFTRLGVSAIRTAPDTYGNTGE